ncbi:unnamed protein product [Lampetra planeri]
MSAVTSRTNDGARGSGAEFTRAGGGGQEAGRLESLCRSFVRDGQRGAALSRRLRDMSPGVFSGVSVRVSFASSSCVFSTLAV